MQVLHMFIAFWGIAVPVLVIAGGVWLFVRLFSSKKTTAGDDEAKIIQECYERLSQMEQRIDTLETLLLDKATPPSPPKQDPTP